MPFFIIFLIIAIAVLAFFFSTYYIVPQGSVAIVERLGKYHKTSTAGLHFCLPLGIDKVAIKLPLRMQQEEMAVETKTKDNVFVVMAIATQYRVSENNVTDAFYKLLRPKAQIQSYIEDALRNAVPKLTLDELFEIELGNHLVAAAKIVFGLEDRFNAGVLLINNKLWKEENIQKQCIEITNNEHETLPEADQTVLNRLCSNRYIVLDDRYNFQIGYDRLAEQRKQYFILEKSLNPLPAIIHYLSDDKPWNLFSFSRLRDVWWKYSLMDWSEIIAHEIPKRLKPILIMTHSQELEQIEILVKRLPECTFNIMALTLMGDKLNSLRKYENVRLYPALLEWNINRLIRECDVYLDINHGWKNQEVIEKVKESGKLILSFENTANEYYTDKIFNLSEIEEMIEHLKHP